MIAQLIEDMCTRLEAAGLTFGPFAFDGTSQEKRVTYGPIDPDSLKNAGLMLGIDFNTPLVTPLGHPVLGVGNIQNIDLVDGTAEYVPPLSWLSRVLYLHFYMHETRPEHLRTGYDLATSYLQNEGRVIAALGGLNALQERRLTVDGTEYGYTSLFESNPFRATEGLDLHSVFQYRVTYPNTEGVQTLPIVLARRIRLVHDLPPGLVPGVDIDLTADPLEPPKPGRVTVIE